MERQGGIMVENEIKILGICGSLRKGSYNRMLLEFAKTLLPEGATLEIIDVGGLPLFDQDSEKQALPEKVKDIKAKVRAADAVLISTPEYNYTIPALLKNALEWASRPYGDNAFDKKPVAIMSASTGMGGGTVAQYHLRQVMVYLNAFVMNKPVVLVPEAQNHFDYAGKVTDKDIEMQLQALLESLVKWTKVIKNGVDADLIA